MKIRNGFVSNSSSSSFIVNDKDITFEQRMMLEYACTLDITGWTYERTYGSTIGYTDMDNFDMSEYMEKIGIPLDRVRWAEHNCDLYLDGEIDYPYADYDTKVKMARSKAKEILKRMDYSSLSDGEI